MDKTLTVTVTISSNDNDNKKIVNVLFPSKQERLSIWHTSHILASGISLLIKTCTISDTGIKDYELIGDIIDHLRSEFSSTESFGDAILHKEVFKKDNKNKNLN